MIAPPMSPTPDTLEDTVPLPAGGGSPPTLPGPTRAAGGRRLQLGGTRGGDRGDLLEEACRRLRIAIAAALFGLALAVVALPFVAPNVGGIRDGLVRPFWTIPLGLVASMAMWFAAGRQQIPAAKRLDLGLLYLVVCSALLSLFTHWLPYDDQLDIVRGPSAVAFVVLAFSTIVPVPPRRLALAAVAAALTDPLALVASFGLGNPVPRPTFWLWLFLPTFGAAAVAVAASRTLYDLSERLDRARQMGAYTLQRLLGSGGMGEVWQAAHRTLARPAAIKLIRADRLGDRPEVAERVRRRFEREAQATAMLQSPHTIAVYDFGVSDDGSFYYVMELLDGMDLGRLLEEAGPLPPGRVVHLLAQACHSLAEAHERGLVHRDIKPANLYACRRGQEVDFVKVLDFGIVKLGSDVEQTQLTEQDGISGTPAFLPPEMAQGHPVDGRADIYSLGCVAFYLLTGQLVFPVGNPMAMLLAHVQSEPRAPSTLVDVPPALDALVLRCLAKDPARRPPSCAALRDELLAAGLAAPWTAEDSQRWWAARGGATALEDPDGVPTILDR
jgi:tRNA A-37 threonylcarbamoyl transferase component Bud32